jgi:hypothetical protein
MHAELSRIRGWRMLVLHSESPRSSKRYLTKEVAALREIGRANSRRSAIRRGKNGAMRSAYCALRIGMPATC